MDDKQIEMPKKKEYLDPDEVCMPTPFDWEIHRKLADEYNLCHEEFTAWLVVRMEGIEKIIEDKVGAAYGQDVIYDLAAAIKTMLLEEQK